MTTDIKFTSQDGNMLHFYDGIQPSCIYADDAAQPAQHTTCYFQVNMVNAKYNFLAWSVWGLSNPRKIRPVIPLSSYSTDARGVAIRIKKRVQFSHTHVDTQGMYVIVQGIIVG